MQLLVFILVYPFLWVISILPHRIFYGFSDFVYFLVYRVVGYRKIVVRNNLELVFPDKSEQEINRIQKEFYKHMCDMFLEMDTAAKIHKVNTLDPTVMDAKTVLKMATINAAKALGLDDVTGSLVSGKKADVIVIDTNKPHLTPMYNLHSHLVYAAGGNDVDTSVINGQVVMENRQLMTMDIAKVMADVNQIAKEISG